MKINSLTISNFVNHTKTVIEPKQINMILGPCQTGKSAIRDAVEYALLGTARGMEGREGKEQLIMNRVGKAEVEIDSDCMKVIRNTNGKLLIDGEITDLKVGQAEILKKIGTNAEALAMVFETEQILNQKATERAKFFSKLFAAKVTGEEFAAMLRKEGYAQEIITEILPLYERGGLKKAFDAAVEKRRQFKRDLEDLENTKTADSIIEIDGKKIDLVAQNVDDLKKENAGYDTEISVLKKRRDEQVLLADKHKAIQGKIDEYQRQITRNDSYMLFNGGLYEVQVRDFKKIAEMESELSGLTTKYDEIGVSINSAVVTANVVDTLELCDSCRTKLATKFREDLASLNKEMETLLAEIDQKKRTIEAYRKRLGFDIRSDFEQTVSQREKAVEALKLEQANEKQAAYSPDVLTKIESGMSSIEAKKKFNDKILFQREQYDNSIKDFASISIKSGKKQIEIAKWDKLANYINPEKNVLVNPIIEKLASRIKQTSSLLNGEISINTDTWDICYKKIPLEFCSRSEKYEIGMIIQDAVSYLLGVSVLFMDGAEIFVGERRVAFSHFLMSIANDYANIFAFASVEVKPSGPQYAKNPEYSGRGDDIMLYLWVENGNVSEING